MRVLERDDRNPRRPQPRHGYPDFSTLKDLSDLVHELDAGSGAHGADDLEQQDLYDMTQHAPGLADYGDIDVYRLAAAGMLTEALFQYKWLYYKANIPFDGMALLSDKQLNTIRPPDLTARLFENEEQSSPTPDHLIVSGAGQLLQGIEEKLNAQGMTYVPFLDKDAITNEQLLTTLGYDPLDGAEAYADMQELERRAQEAGITLSELYTPMNSAKAIIGLRYGAEVPRYLSIIDTIGVKNAFSAFLNAETPEEALFLPGGKETKPL